MAANTLRFFCIFAPLALWTATALAETYYVDGDSGDDGYNGLAANYEVGTHGPRRTWSWFSGSTAGPLAAGDRVLFRRGTTIRRDDAGIDMRVSNVDDVTFGAYGDPSLPNPVLDSRGSQALYIGYNGPTHNLVFEDLTFITSLPRPSGSMITAYSREDVGPGYAEGVTFRRIEVDATNETGVDPTDETVTFAADNVTIEDSYIHDGGRTGIYVSGRMCVFQRNVVENFLVGIKLNDDTRVWGPPFHVIVRRNLLINTGVSIELGTCHHNDVYANVTVGTGPGRPADPRQFGVQMEGDVAHHNNVFNNTVVLSAVGGDHHGLRMYHRAGDGNVYKNNLVYFYDDFDDDDHFFFKHADAGMPQIDYNLYFTDGPSSWYRDGTDYTTLAAWTASAGMPDAHSVVADPLFLADPRRLDPRDSAYSLSTSSPAVDRGTAVTMYTSLPYEDFLGNPYVGPPDIGAFELQPAPTCAGSDVCASGEECVGGTLDGLCCVSGSCQSPADAGGADAGGSDAGAGDGGLFDSGAGNVGPTDGGGEPGADAGSAAGDVSGCACRVGTQSRGPGKALPPLALLALLSSARRRRARGR